MVMKRRQLPAKQGEGLLRPQDALQLFENEVLNDTVVRISQDVECRAYRKFGIFVYIDSTGSPTTLQIKVEFLDRWTGKWYHFKQGLFAALFWEDTDTADGIYEAFQGEVLGRAIRITLTGVGTSAQALFTVSIGLDLWN